MMSLDFWQIENRLIQENRVMVDILDAYRQLGVDVFARSRSSTERACLAAFHSRLAMLEAAPKPG